MNLDVIDGRSALYVGDCVEGMKRLGPGTVDAIVTDPPYGLRFMARKWDNLGGGAGEQIEWHRRWAVEALRVLKPGGHVLAFGGSRTFQYLAVGLEVAGFEIRDVLAWMYGQGFPKSLDVGKALDDWAGWGTALKPAYEPIVMARKPLVGTVVANVLAHGTGAINVDATRIGDADTRGVASPTALGLVNDDGWQPKPVVAGSASGRWPANVLLDDEAAALLDAQAGERGGGFGVRGGQRDALLSGLGGHGETVGYGDRGGPSRFYYVAKASRAEREAGLEAFAEARRSDGRESDIENPRLRTSARRNDHPTVKPIAVMRWLVRLVTPPDGLVLDPFTGSGTTGIAAALEGFRFLGMEIDQHNCDIALARIQYWSSPAPAPERESA